MGNSIVPIEGNTLKVDDNEYELTPGLIMLMLYKKPRPQHYPSDGYYVYKAIVAHTRRGANPNKRTGSARPSSTWKWKHMRRVMAIPGDRVEEDEGISKVQFQTAIGHHHLISCTRLTFHAILSLEKLERGGRPAFYKGYGVVYLPADIKGLTDKLHLLSAEFFAGNNASRNELVHVLAALLRLKHLTRR